MEIGNLHTGIGPSSSLSELYAVVWHSKKGREEIRSMFQTLRMLNND